MMRQSMVISALLLLCSMTGTAAAQAPPAGQAPAAVPAPAVVKAPPAAKAPAASSALGEAGEPRARAREAPAGPGTPADKRTDRVDLDTTTVTGNRELPKVMYVVPWKKSDIGDFVGKPMNSLLDEVLAPVDRDVFRREVTYYHALNGEAGQNPAGPPAPSPQPPAPIPQGEK